MSDPYDHLYFETDNDGVDYACYLDLINDSITVYDDDFIECVEIDLDTLINETEFDDYA